MPDKDKDTNPKQSKFVKSFKFLSEKLGHEDLRIVDASWYLPNQNRNAIEDYQKSHIPGAIFFDQDKIVNPNSSLPHALPDPKSFATAVGAMGISENHTIVIYDGIGLFSSPRVWWMFKIMGAKSVYVLNGSFDDWKAEGYPTDTKDASIQAHTFPANTFPAHTFNTNFDQDAVADIDDIMNAVKNGAPQILDARGQGRFYGTEPEPRQGMRSGHMPGAKNLPFPNLLKDGKLHNINNLEDIFNKLDIDLNQPIITTCGSGVTAAIITLALNSANHFDNKLYDGSWSEWGSRQDTPVSQS